MRGFGGETREMEMHGRPRRRRKNNIKMYLEVEREGMDWLDLAQETSSGALVNAVMCVGFHAGNLSS